MRKTALVLLAAASLMSIALWAQQHKLVYSKDGAGVFGYKDTAVQPWSGYVVHDPDRPVPRKVDAGDPVSRPPSDAIVLFDGKDISKWKPTKWKVENGYVETTEGPFKTRDEYGSYQLHLEWRQPTEPDANIMNRGNNGVLLMDLFEIQIFDSWGTKIYPDGQAASVYGQTPPLVNAMRPPGAWESYDIVFIVPQFQDGKLSQRARVTVFHNGILVQHDQEIYGTTGHAVLPGAYPAGKTRGPLSLSGHHCPVRFRNIWLRPL